MLLSGSSSQSLAAALAAATGERLGDVTYDSFPDGEQLVTVPPAVDGERAVIVASTPTSDAHIEVLQLQDAARDAGASEIITVLPYMGYARQDDAFDPGQPVSARAVARAISTGTDRVLTVNPHEDGVLECFDVPAAGVDAAPQLAAPLPADLTDPVFLSPDHGATDLATSVRDAYGTGVTDHFQKVRHSGSDVTIEPSEIQTAGRDVVVTDDIVATGTTMSEAITALDDPARVFVATVHPLLAGNARLKLARAGVEAVYGTDTIERAVSEVSAAPAIADAL
ncbi:ribose-phosphate diphosphokinase [Halobacterium salinarum]|uniref:ribose-phosphate diphosphokinase n=1 Tax=Halobacterium salinarum TaxID=2242 RepID=UPI001F4126A5|nr:ribose-phosphate diphosphokinase [Halobacterium salinarum]MCF2206251.1 ribose-phosphate diphosphokinase [Halobacterium salinarum]MCF2240313.1 ribose-phosphate diphosphokinase [Halobacterium salinarum]